MATRTDFARIDTKHRTPQGGLRLPANLTRVGVLEYRTRDGKVRRELRPAEEVFHEDSLASLADAPVTIGHPSGVNRSNWSALAVGHVREPRAAAPFVAGAVIVQRDDGVQGVESGTLVELSCGYTVREDHTPGVYEGLPYDLVQRDIRYNHVGLGPRNWGRAGNDVALKFDGLADHEVSETGDYAPSVTPHEEGTHHKDSSMTLEEALKLNEQLRKDGEVARAERDAVKAERDAARADAAKAQARVDSIESDRGKDRDLFNDRVKARVALETRAAKLGVKSFTDEKGALRADSDIMVEAIQKSDAKFDAKGKSEDYLRARFDMLEVSDRSDAERARLQVIAATGREDTEEDPIEAARLRMLKRQDKMWTGEDADEGGK